MVISHPDLSFYDSFFTSCSRMVVKVTHETRVSIRKFLINNQDTCAQIRAPPTYFWIHTYATHMRRRGYSRSRDRTQETCLCVRTDRMYGPACTSGPTAKTGLSSAPRRAAFAFAKVTFLRVYFVVDLRGV